MLVSHLILPLGKCLMLSLYSHFSLILAIYAHILGTHAGLSSHLAQQFFAHFSNLCSHFRNSCWSLISFYLLLASF